MVTKIIKILKNIYNIPVITPVLFVYQMYLVKKITDDSDPTDTAQITDAEQLQDMLEPYCKVFMEKYEMIINIVSIYVWVKIFKMFVIIIFFS